MVNSASNNSSFHSFSERTWRKPTIKANLIAFLTEHRHI